MNYRDIKQPNYRHVGKYTPRKEAKEIVTGKALFLDDFSVPHMLHGKIKRSPYPHAKILSIDASAAEALEGVRAVITHKNLPQPWGLGLPVHRLLMEDKVYHVGDVVALIAADTLEIAQAAIDLIKVEYEQLEPVYSAEEAFKENAPELYARFPGNHVDNGIKYFQPDGPWWQIIKGDVQKGFEEAAFVAEDKISFDKMPAPLAPETPSCIAQHDGGDNYTIWASSQSAHIMKLMAEGRIPNSNVSVKTFNVGGSYGNKQSLMTTVLSAAMLALTTQRPVKLALTKAEQLMSYEVRLGSTITAKVGMNKDGYVTAVQGDWLVDTGAIADSVQGQVGVGLGEAQLVLAKCKNWYMDSHIAVTNRQAAGIVRGYGGQELNSCLERLLCAAMKAGDFDPLDVFKKNYISPGDTFTWRDGRTWKSRSSFFFKDAMQAAADRIGWAEKWTGWNLPFSVKGTKARGVGMGVIGNADISEDNTEAIVRIVPDLVGGKRASTCIIECDITESGMGTRSNACKIAAEVLNVPYEKVSITEPGTKYNPSNYGLCGSRGVITTGKAISNAALEAKQKALDYAALYFKRSVDQLDTRDFMVYVRDTPNLMVPMFKLGPKELSIVGYGKHMEMFDIPSCVAFFVEVEVDLETGHIEICKISAGSDVGQVIDSKALEMQYHGGIGSACVDTAIFEENILDRSTGRLLSSSLIDYKWRTFNEFPPYEAYTMESQIDSFMFKALGLGEISGAAGASAVLMAVSNAIGADVKEYPATPAVVLKAMGKI
jgi:CO/xanthine dehydrogenase Mo-binding subunit